MQKTFILQIYNYQNPLQKNDKKLVITQPTYKKMHKNKTVYPLIKSSSLILLCPNTNNSYETLLLKRKSNMSFNNSFVFPGGVVESADKIQAQKKYQDVFQEYSKITALREFLEETGLLIYPKVKDLGEIEGRSLEEVSARLGDIWKGNLGMIQPVLRLMTPQIQKGKRYDCIFHTLILSPQLKIFNHSSNKSVQFLKQQQIQYNKSQSDSIIISTPAQILSMWKQNKIALAPPQIIILHCLINYFKGNRKGEFILGRKYVEETGEQLEPIMFDYQVQLAKMLIFGDQSYLENDILQKQPESESKRDYLLYIKRNNQNKIQKGIRRIQLGKNPKLTSSIPFKQEKTLLKYIVSSGVSPSPKL